jgi:hypothetical protein
VFSIRVFHFKSVTADTGEEICSISSWVPDNGAVSDIGTVISFWIVISEISCFIMGYPAGAMKPWHFVSISSLNCIMNIALIVVMTPVLSCFDYKNDKVNCMLN